MVTNQTIMAFPVAIMGSISYNEWTETNKNHKMWSKTFFFGQKDKKIIGSLHPDKKQLSTATNTALLLCKHLQGQQAYFFWTQSTVSDILEFAAVHHQVQEEQQEIKLLSKLKVQLC